YAANLAPCARVAAARRRLLTGPQIGRRWRQRGALDSASRDTVAGARAGSDRFLAHCAERARLEPAQINGRLVAGAYDVRIDEHRAPPRNRERRTDPANEKIRQLAGSAHR